MVLKFTGKDDSMGLKHGKVYPVSIISKPFDKYIFVRWSNRVGEVRICPYSSLSALAANWEVTEDGK